MSSIYKTVDIKEIEELGQENISDLTDEDLLTILTRFTMNGKRLIEYDESYSGGIMINFHVTIWIIFREARIIRKLIRTTIEVPVTYSEEEIDNMSKEELENFVNNSEYPLRSNMIFEEMNKMPFDLYRARNRLKKLLKHDKYINNQLLVEDDNIRVYNRQIGHIISMGYDS